MSCWYSLQQDSLKMFALDCPKWKEQHGCEGGPVRNVCKKTCDLCGKPHKDNLFYQILKKIHEYSILSPILQRMIVNQNLNVKPQIVVKLVNMNLMNIINVNAFAVMRRTH